MIFFLASLLVLFFSSFLSLAAGKQPRLSSLLGAGGAVAGSLLGLAPVLRILFFGGAGISFRAGWGLPFGSFYLGIDKLSSFFLFLILLLSALSAVYGHAYFLHREGKKSPGIPWFFFNLLVASMMLVVSARNGLFFLIAWEVMSLSSFFLVTLENEKESVRKAGWTYLVATHLGTAFLFVLFILLGQQSGSLDFEKLSAQASGIPFLPGIAFVLALIGFGTKAGLMPLHTWLPEAHPAAPSPVSALMSGVMIKTGIYGLMRIGMFLGAPEPWWGFLLIGIGLLSGILGILLASAQKELKTLLAYSSVENIGIIAMALGLGTLALSWGRSEVALLAFAGALLHVANHALFKGMLFLGAGSVLHGAKTGALDRLGGLFKKMPWTGTSFLVGSCAISGLPPLNGFVGEFLIYLGALHFLLSGKGGAWISLSIVGGLAFIGALACATFTKAFGIVFLGSPRTKEAAAAHEAGWAMRLPLLTLASLCFLVSIFSPFALRPLGAVVAELTGLGESAGPSLVASGWGPLVVVSLFSLGILGLVLVLCLVRALLLSRRRVEQAVTWDCGYAVPTPRMQYTGSSFLNLLADVLKPLLWIRRRFSPPEGYFPKKSSLSTQTLDFFYEAIFVPLFVGIKWVAARLRWLQHGRTHLYVLYIAIVLFLLLVWNLR